MTSVFAAVAVAAAVAAAPPSVDPSGHWEGAVNAPSTAVAFQVDIARTASGALAGAITIPSQHLNELPLAKIAVDGASIVFGAREDQLLEAAIDGDKMAGTFSFSTMSLPFTLTRTGDARLSPPPTSAHIPSELEGTWRGALDDGGSALDLVLTMTNQPDGTAVGTIVNLSEGGLRIPIVITRNASTITLESRAVEGTFTGELTPAGELKGTFRQGAAAVPLTFTRR